jgi:hypothetical protein
VDTSAISGFVKGAFFGPQAAAVGGVVDITKSRSGSSVNPAGLVKAVQSGYTNGRYVAPFITGRSDLVERR